MTHTEFVNEMAEATAALKNRKRVMEVPVHPEPIEDVGEPVPQAQHSSYDSMVFADEPIPTPTPTTPNKARGPRESKAHPILQKMRRQVGLQVDSDQDGNTVDIEGVKFRLRPLNARQLAAAMRTTEMEAVTTNEQIRMVEISLMSYAIAAVDGVDVEEVFSIPKEVGATRQEIPAMRRQEMAAAQCFLFLSTEANPEIIATLVQFYENSVDPNHGKFLVRCKNCGYTRRIKDKSQICYCPDHGDSLEVAEVNPT